MYVLKSLKNIEFPDQEVFDYPDSKKFSVLFMLKSRNRTWNPNNIYSKGSSGLLNSATFVSRLLNKAGIKSDVAVIDGVRIEIDNCIRAYNPDIIILEAVWINFDLLKSLASASRHKHRKWIIRCHSEIPFLVTEGSAISTFINYSRIENVYLSCNSPRTVDDINVILKSKRIIPSKPVCFLPNYYDVGNLEKSEKNIVSEFLNVSCFGAIRPFKNHVQQAIAAMMCADELNKKLKFHINSSRVEGGGDPCLVALKKIFEESCHELVEHLWVDHIDFINLCKSMDLGLQVSFTESFNIVGADHICNGVPVVGSKEIPWISEEFQADPCDSIDIKNKMIFALKSGSESQFEDLKKYSIKSRAIWLDTVTKIYISK